MYLLKYRRQERSGGKEFIRVVTGKHSSVLLVYAINVRSLCLVLTQPIVRIK